jgi:hypothetical protein
MARTVGAVGNETTTLSAGSQSGQVKTRLTRKLLAALNAAPEKVLFPKSNMG